MNEKIILRLFLIDGIGAFVSAIMLGVILPLVQPLIGIPVYALYILATFPVIFSIIDFYCLYRKPQPLTKYLKIIAICNILYCYLSCALAYYHRASITDLGWVYLVVEVFIVGALAIVELRYARTKK